MLIRLAAFPTIKTLEEFEFDAVPGAPKARIQKREMERLFIGIWGWVFGKAFSGSIAAKESDSDAKVKWDLQFCG